MIERFNAELEVGKIQSAKAKEAKVEKKQLSDNRNKLRQEIKILETQLAELGMKKSEIRKMKDAIKGDCIAEENEL